MASSRIPQIALLLLALAPPMTGDAAPPPAPKAPTCGLVPELIPDFALEDQNPSSSTYGQTIQRDETLGQVLLIYFATAT